MHHPFGNHIKDEPAMITLQQIEEKYDFIFPEFFKKLWDDGMLNYMRGFDERLKEGENWIDTVYPVLKENPRHSFTQGNHSSLCLPMKCC